MKTPAPIHIFRPGTQTDVSGTTLAFTEAMLEASAKAYDPALHEAPLVVGHPQTDAPAYGWVQALAFSQSGLAASPHQVDPEFAELVRAGRFKKISASFYTPDSPQNPVPGVFYLRHVGFLGAAAPAVKGLKPVAFAAGEEGVVEFATFGEGDAWAERQNANLWRSFREWLASQFGQDAADQALPQNHLAQPAFAEGAAKPKSKEDDVDQKELDAARAKLVEERAALDKDKADFAETKAKADQAVLLVTHEQHLAFAEGLVKEGKLLPANKLATVALLDNLAATGASLEFAEEGGTKTSKPALQSMKDMLQSAPKLVDFTERATGDPNALASGGGSVSFAAPQGFTVDATGLELHTKALAYQAAHQGVDYITAVTAVSAGGK
ncbi:MAG: peptidase [Deltaproteobacteria bacterium HGW-Deltaproteobacteria-8]|nr:MAG: peptidase [Deltaproteobacteria bacterium HGW-Deltaproteobacteria-8]